MARDPYDDAERDYIRATAAFLKDREIAERFPFLFGREVTPRSIGKQRTRMGLPKCSGQGVCKLDDSGHGVIDFDFIFGDLRSRGQGVGGVED